MNVRFWVRKNYISSDGTSQIMCTISNAGKKKEFATRLSVAPDLWRQAKQRIVGADAEYTNDALDKIRARLTEIKRDFEAKDKKYTLLQVKEAFFLNRLLVSEQVMPLETNICDDLAQIQKIRTELLALTNATREKSFFNIFVKFLKANKLHNLMSCQIEKKTYFYVFGRFAKNEKHYQKQIQYVS